jgi:uncharacterized protein (DUF1810 family)
VALPGSFDLHRFIEAQATTFETALAELRAGKKESHWMWFIFPQLAALGRSATARFYGIASLSEAQAYFEHQVLGPRLQLCVETLEPWARVRTAEEILGPVDAMKLRSCLTLFDRARPESIFEQALVHLFAGERDQLTLALLGSQQ